MKDDKRLDREILDVIMERPYPFSVGHKNFYLYPVTLGKMLLLQRQIESLDVMQDVLALSTELEMLRLVEDKKEACCTIIAIHTCKTKEEVFSPKVIEERRNLFVKEVPNEDIASLLLYLLSGDNMAEYMRHLGIDKEQGALKRASDIKRRNDKNSLSFGGMSLYGSFIYPLLELGMSWDEIVWQRSYINLRMLLSDKITSVYLSDDELKKTPAWIKNRSDDVIKPTKENMEAILSMDWR